mgnify:CR=1 FL=1
MAENLDQSFNFSIENTMEMGLGNAELLNDLMSPETSTTNPDDIKDINTPEPEKKEAPVKEAEKKSEAAPKEDPSKSIHDFLTNEGGDNDDEEEQTNDKDFISGIINRFSIGNYNDMFKEYKSGMMSIFPIYEPDSFKRYKESKLPPSSNGTTTGRSGFSKNQQTSGYAGGDGRVLSKDQRIQSPDDNLYFISLVRTIQDTKNLFDYIYLYI